MAEILNMPKLGMDMEEGTVLRWLKKEGEAVKKGEPIVEVETDKASMEVESPAEGIILRIYCAEGDSMPINRPIAAIGAAGEQVAENPASNTSQENKPADSVPAVKTSSGGEIPGTEGLLKMPKLGMDMEEGTILRWLKKEGETVKKGEPIVEIETDKASMEVEAPASGILLRIYCAEGDSSPINQPIAFIGSKDTEIPLITKAAADVPSSGMLAPACVAPAVHAPAQEIPPESPRSKGLRASPRARRLAQKHGIDLSFVEATGPANRIMEKDVRRAIETKPAASIRRQNRKRGQTIQPLSGIRKVIATRMHQSLSDMAQANHRIDADMTNMAALRKQINNSPEFSEAKISFMDLLVLACTRALGDCPFANVSLMQDGIHQKDFINIGIAVDTPRGLLVPVLHDADLMDVRQISAENKRLINAARGGTLKPDEMSGGTFTISNLGMFGIDSFTAIINPPEACILAVGRIADKVVAFNGAMTIRPMMTLSLTYDHRIIDGAPAARLLQKLQYYIENPALLLM